MGVQTNHRLAGRGARGRRAGLTLLELVFAMSVLAIALVAYARTVAMATVATRSTREASLAYDAARRTIEALRATDFDDVFRMYNDMTGDDPGPGAAPGAHFAVQGLDARNGDVDGMPGEILFPTSAGGGVVELRENIVDAALGMPSDLNGDGTIDVANHAGDYEKLPVLVRVRWRGAAGAGQVELQTVLGGY